MSAFSQSGFLHTVGLSSLPDLATPTCCQWLCSGKWIEEFAPEQGR